MMQISVYQFYQVLANLARIRVAEVVSGWVRRNIQAGGRILANLGPRVDRTRNLLNRRDALPARALPE